MTRFCLRPGVLRKMRRLASGLAREAPRSAPRRWPFVGLRPRAYRVILIDAPFKFSSGPSRNPNRHYATMTLAEIAALPVGELAHPEGCRLFMWITMPHLHRIPELLSAWGFRFCTARPWLKLWPSEDGSILTPDSFSIGTGYEVRNSSELQVIAKRGRPQRLGGVKLRGHIIAPRREHSRKPDCVRDEIVELFDGPRCELFARSRHPGFACWGDEVGRF
jgi:N6-adenosine-specific RNA methylase IME4